MAARSPWQSARTAGFLYVGCREITQLVSFEIDQASGGLTRNGSIALDAWPVYVATDRRGRFVLSSYYQGALRRRASHRR